jgi:hypothetical protein
MMMGKRLASLGVEYPTVSQWSLAIPPENKTKLRPETIMSAFLLSLCMNPLLFCFIGSGEIGAIQPSVHPGFPWSA